MRGGSWDTPKIAISAEEMYPFSPMQGWYTFAYIIDDETMGDIRAALFMLGLISVGAWFLYRHIRRRREAFRWPLIEATIQSEFAANLAGPGVGMAVAGIAGSVAARNAYNCVLQYSYQVAEEFYAGYIVLGGPYASSGDASAAARPWLGKKISVRYNPAQPHQSALLPEDGAPAGMRGCGETPPASSDVITLSLK